MLQCFSKCLFQCMNEWVSEWLTDWRKELSSHTCSGLQGFLERFWGLEKHRKAVSLTHISQSLAEMQSKGSELGSNLFKCQATWLKIAVRSYLLLFPQTDAGTQTCPMTHLICLLSFMHHGWSTVIFRFSDPRNLGCQQGRRLLIKELMRKTLTFCLFGDANSLASSPLLSPNRPAFHRPEKEKLSTKHRWCLWFSV